MEEINANPHRERSSRDELPDQLRQLQDAHTAHGSSLEKAFTPEVRGILRRLSDEDDDTFFQTLFSRDTSTETSSSTTDTTDTTESTATTRPATPIPPEDAPHPWDPRTVFKFIHDEFMSVQPNERMATVHNFLDRMKKTASESDAVAVVVTVKDAVCTRFGSVVALGMKKFKGTSSSFSCQRPTEGNVPNPHGTHQTAPEQRTMRTPMRNPQLTQLSTPPMHAAGIASRFPRTEQPHPSVIQTNPGYSGGTRPSEVNRNDRSRSGSSSPSSSPRKRNPLTRQDHVREHD